MHATECASTSAGVDEGVQEPVSWHNSTLEVAVAWGDQPFDLEGDESYVEVLYDTAGLAEAWYMT